MESKIGNIFFERISVFGNESFFSERTEGFRFGFNKGSEKDNEIYGTGNAYTTFLRELDPRLGGRWWSTDSKMKAFESPYVGFSDNPILFSDPKGDDVKDPKGTVEHIGNGITASADSKTIYNTPNTKGANWDVGTWNDKTNKYDLHKSGLSFNWTGKPSSGAEPAQSSSTLDKVAAANTQTSIVAAGTEEVLNVMQENAGALKLTENVALKELGKATGIGAASIDLYNIIKNPKDVNAYVNLAIDVPLIFVKTDPIVFIGITILQMAKDAMIENAQQQVSPNATKNQPTQTPNSPKPKQ
ncbi:MAG TPA: hypothetical protein VNG53_00425 [Bacteroidia bacterium]|nr:hypothetical protein [Bacteroidia bacterium]